MGKSRTKLVLEFDKDKRKEYLTGFRKRKNERRRKAQLEIEQKVRDEKARIRKKRQDAINQRLEEITNIKLVSFFFFFVLVFTGRGKLVALYSFNLLH